MKIGFTGLQIPEGKIKYNDKIVNKLAEKFEPKKVTPYFFEFIKDEYIQIDAIVINKENILDLLINDIEKLENRRDNSNDDNEKELVQRCLEQLENEKPVCDLEFNDEEKAIINNLAPDSLKPTLVVEEDIIDLDHMIEQIMAKAEVMFFYTAGKQEVHAWFTKCGSDIVTCAGKIHTDLARGFIKGDVLKFSDIDKVHNFNDAKSNGVSKVVDRDYIVQPEEIIEIRFNV